MTMSRFVRALFGAALLIAIADGSSEAAPDFNRDVAPILVKRCLECHSPHKSMGGLVMTERALMLKGGDGGPGLSATELEKSLLLERVMAGEMPPEQRGESRKLPADEIRILREWIAGGAKWPAGRTIDLYESTSDVRGGRDWWSLQPVERPKIPAALTKSETPSMRLSAGSYRSTVSSPLHRQIVER